MTKPALRHVEYDAHESASTENHRSVDAQMEEVNEHPGGEQNLAFEEGFAASSGIRPESAETGGRIDHPEMLDDSMPDPLPESLEEENPGLADN